MRNEKYCFVRLLPYIQQKLSHLAPGLRVKSAEGLIHENDVRVGNHSSGKGNALLHAAGNFTRIPVMTAFKSEALDEIKGPVAAFVQWVCPSFQDRRRYSPRLCAREKEHTPEKQSRPASMARQALVPCMRISPDVAYSRPAIMRRSVVLPQPLGPMMETKLPVSTVQVYAVKDNSLST